MTGGNTNPGFFSAFAFALALRMTDEHNDDFLIADIAQEPHAYNLWITYKHQFLSIQHTLVWQVRFYTNGTYGTRMTLMDSRWWYSGNESFWYR